MKTKNLMMMAATLLVAGCSQNEITEMNPDADKAIGFGVYSGVQTRGTETNVATLKNGFGVFAYHTGTTDWNSAKTTATPNFMYNQKVTSTDGNTWAYTPVKYWPTKEEKVTFFAYAPHSTISGSGVTVPTAASMTAAPKLTFALETTGDATKMVDFVVAKNNENTTQNRTYTTSGTDGVAFTFEHTLSRLTFEGKPSADLATNTATKGTTYVMVKSAKILTATNFYKSAIYDCETAAWSNKTRADAAYNITNVLNLTTQTSIVTNPADQASNAYNAIALTKTSGLPSLFKQGEYLFLIPETAKNGAGTSSIDALQIEFKYDIVTVDTKVTKGYTLTSHTAVAKLPTGALKQGTAYKYTVTFGINEVKIAIPTVETWGTETPETITA